MFEGCVDRWDKDEAYKNQMFINEDSKEELQSCDARMREELGDHADYNQPRELREHTFGKAES